MSTIRSSELRAGVYDKFFTPDLVLKAGIRKLAVEERANSFLVSLPPKSRVLDLAAGAGCESLLIEKSGKSAYPLDISRKMLCLQEVTEKNGLDNKDFLSRRVQGDIFRLPFFDGVFDAACFFHILELGMTSERESMLTEAGRVLTQKGRLFIVTEWIPRNILKVGGQGFVGKEEELIAQSRRFLDSVPIYFEQVRMKKVYLRKLLERSGFSNISVKRCSSDFSRWSGSSLIFAEAQKS